MSEESPKKSSLGQVVAASMIGTTIEWYDFFLYGTAAALVFNKLFFPTSDPLVGTMLAFATYAVGFVARPLGAAVLGYYGDVKGRRATLIASLLLMGVSTFLIAFLPTYATIGIAAPIALVLLRLIQGFALGGEWGGAVLLAVENAPPHKRAWYGMFPQLGAPIGFFMSGGVFLLLSRALTEAQFIAWGWRIPFLASAVLVFVGLYVRLTISETPLFRDALQRSQRVEVPMLTVFQHHAGPLLFGTMTALTTFVLLLDKNRPRLLEPKPPVTKPPPAVTPR